MPAKVKGKAGDAPQPRKVGRPSTFRMEIAEEICTRIANGEMLIRICSDDDMPPRSTVVKWLLGLGISPGEHDKFRTMYALAREVQADTLFDESLDIADDATRDWKTVGKEGNEREVPDSEVVQRSRLRVDTRFRMAQILNRAKYAPDKLKGAGDEGDDGTTKVIVKGGLPDA